MLASGSSKKSVGQKTTDNGLLDNSIKAHVEIPLFIQPENGRYGTTALSDYRYLPDLNFYGSNQMSVAYVDQDGFTEFRHVHLEVRNTQDPTLFSGNIQVGSEKTTFIVVQSGRLILTTC